MIRLDGFKMPNFSSKKNYFKLMKIGANGNHDNETLTCISEISYPSPISSIYITNNSIPADSLGQDSPLKEKFKNAN